MQETAYGCQSAIAAADTVVPVRLQMVEERENQRGINVDEMQIDSWLFKLLLTKMQE